MRSDMTVTFLGGASGIGASCALLEVGETRVLVDCGIRFQANGRLPGLSQLDGKHLDAIVVTHAHTDHTGALPIVCDAFPQTPVYATPPTLDLVTILLRDALKVMNNPAERDSELPLYAERQVQRVAEVAVPVHHGASVSIGPARLTFLAASHILGASMAHIDTPAGAALFTGDYSVSAQRSVPALNRPTVRADLVVTEATYGNRLHEDRHAAEQRLITRIRDVLTDGGRVLVPAFAIGRAQEILLILKAAQRNGQLPNVPVFVDGMVRTVCDIYGRHDRYVSRALLHEIRRARHAFFEEPIKPVYSNDDRRRALEAGPCVVVASSGMLSGGASVHYAQAFAPNERDAILITGYQDEESPGSALLRLADTPSEDRRELKLAGVTVAMRCQVDKYGLSAHADRMQMAALLDALQPRSVVLVHGDEQAKQELKRSLSCKDVVLAHDGDLIRRSYPVRKQPVTRAAAPAGELDFDTARRLLGPATDRPLNARTVAEAFFGAAVGRDARERLVDDLEAMGLARRDDHQRSLIWVLTPEDSDAMPDEAALAQQLKKQNPKGRLLEFCHRACVSPPEVQHVGVDGHEYLVRMSFAHDGLLYDSDVQRASSKKVAEQLAAQKLLVALQEYHARFDVGGRVDSEEQANQLKSTNPKGRILELFSKSRSQPPSFETRATIDGTLVRVGWSGSDESTIWSPWYLAADTKTAEQAAAQAFFDMREKQFLSAKPNPSVRKGGDNSTCHSHETFDPGVPEKSPPVVQMPARTTTSDFRPALNEMRQLGVVTDFGYQLVEMKGPSHQPIFVMSAWADMPSGERVVTDGVEGSSKKAAERWSAQILHGMLDERGFA